ncbi:MAG: dephospho-CoA kinase [Alistipes putredinis]|nr:MAG: dephospho-CoA kinase [Alistipes putredinis]
MFAEHGVPVFDTDSAAKSIMSGDKCIKKRIVDLLGEKAYEDGRLNRKYVSAAVFSDKGLLHALNSIVHPAVARKFELWAGKQNAPYVIMECAILLESGFDRLVDKIVAVSATEQSRIRRTALRDGVEEESVKTNRQSNERKRAPVARRLYNREYGFEINRRASRTAG